MEVTFILSLLIVVGGFGVSLWLCGFGVMLHKKPKTEKSDATTTGALGTVVASVVKERAEGDKAKAVSEPVTSFVECILSNPRRFSISVLVRGNLVVDYYYCRIVDLHTGEQFTGKHMPANFKRSSEYYTAKGISWITQGELAYIKAKIFDPRQTRYEKRLQRKAKLRNLLLNRGRDRLTAIYQGA